MKKFQTILKNNLIALIAIAIILAGTGTVYGALNAQEEDFGENPAAAENPNKTQVLLEGKGYSLTKEQKQKYDLPQKIIVKKPDEIRKYNPSNRPGNNGYRPGKPPYGNNRNFNPVIKTNLTNRTMTAGSELSFWVEGKTYASAVIKSTNYTVTIGNTTIEKDGSSSSTHAVYTTDKVAVGKNKITIKVTDPVRKKATRKTYTVTGKKEEETKYTVTASFSAPDLYYLDETEVGFSMKVTCECEKGDSSQKIISAIDEQLAAQGFDAEWEGNSLVNLILPEEAYILVPLGDTEPGEDTEYEKITATELNEDAFDGTFTWSTNGVPDTLTKDITVTCVYE